MAKSFFNFESAWGAKYREYGNLFNVDSLDIDQIFLKFAQR